MASIRRQQRLMSVKSQYMIRDNETFTSSSPRPEAEGREMTGLPSSLECGQTGGFRQARANPIFFESKNRNSTDVAYRQRQSQKAQNFEDIHESVQLQEKKTAVSTAGEGLLQELYADQSKRLEKAENALNGAQKARDTLEKKCMELQAELTAQTQVNKELKKLLVASMGADLQLQLEGMARDRAQLAQDLENTMTALLKERESLEKVNIQCDVWRSKFLGSRLQVDELVSSRTHLDMLQQESCHALQKLLDERAEMRRHMMSTNRLLQYLSRALQRNHSITEESSKTPSNVITLALVNEQLSSTISSVLLGDVGRHHQGPEGGNIPGQRGFNFVDWTTAEMLAKDILLNKQPIMKLEQIQQQSFLQGPVPKVNMTHRYHPHTRYENITVNCCNRCKGEIHVV
ncbi:golgin-45-like [Diadema setosum]|uniref:golgin-45-like n=1 Tax=Diadema setosum TaxID=31175 RepID=UPI003B3BD915